MKDYHENRGGESNAVQTEKVRLFRGLRILVWIVIIMLMIPVVLFAFGILIGIGSGVAPRSETRSVISNSAFAPEDPGAVAYRKAAQAKEEADRRAMEEQRAKSAEEQRIAKEERVRRFREEAEAKRSAATNAP